MQKVTTYHFTYEGNQIKCVRAVETRQETMTERSTPWILIALGALAIYGVIAL